MAEKQTVRKCCRQLERAIVDLLNPLHFDSELMEYRIRRIDNGYSIICFCPFCGCEFPPGKRAALFMEPDPEELHDAGLMAGMKDIEEVIEALGVPDELIESNGMSQYRFGRRWRTIDLIVKRCEGSQLDFCAVPKPL